MIYVLELVFSDNLTHKTTYTTNKLNMKNNNFLNCSFIENIIEEFETDQKIELDDETIGYFKNIKIPFLRKEFIDFSNSVKNLDLLQIYEFFEKPIDAYARKVYNIETESVEHKIKLLSEYPLMCKYVYEENFHYNIDKYIIKHKNDFYYIKEGFNFNNERYNEEYLQIFLTIKKKKTFDATFLIINLNADISNNLCDDSEQILNLTIVHNDKMSLISTKGTKENSFQIVVYENIKIGTTEISIKNFFLQGCCWPTFYCSNTSIKMTTYVFHDENDKNKIINDMSLEELIKHKNVSEDILYKEFYNSCNYSHTDTHQNIKQSINKYNYVVQGLLLLEITKN